jgi:hypothetical protein
VASSGRGAPLSLAGTLCPPDRALKPPCSPDRPSALRRAAAAAINSTCQALNDTGCCTEVAGNWTWVQYGLGVSRTADRTAGRTASSAATLPACQY